MGRFPPPGFQPMARLSVDDSRLTLSVLRDIQLPPLYHRRRGLVKGFLGPAVRLPARFMDVIASHVLANALTPHVSACHCEPVPCPADTPQVSAYPTRQTVLQPQMRICLQHVIANQCAHLWQSASPGRNVVHCTRARVRTYLPNLSLRTSAHTGAAIRVPWQKRGTLHPCPGAHIPTKPVIANQCAHWCGNPFPRRETWQAGNT